MFIERNRKKYKVVFLCKWLNVSKSGYYSWRKRLPSKRAIKNNKLSEIILDIYIKNRGVYGSPRIHERLKQQGIIVGKSLIARLMQKLKVQARVVKVTSRQPGLKRFTAQGKNLRLIQPKSTNINQIWVADITYLKVKNKWLYLSVIMDIHSRKIISWSLGKRRTTDVS